MLDCVARGENPKSVTNSDPLPESCAITGHVMRDTLGIEKRTLTNQKVRREFAAPNLTAFRVAFQEALYTNVWISGKRPET